MTYNRKSQITPYTERENTMTKTTAPEGIEDKPGTAKAKGHATEPTKTEQAAATQPELVTEWANSTDPENFDADQAAVHDWMEASDDLRLEALETAMTIADAEELIATARAVATEHSRRAERARNLVTIIASRLGREADALNAIDPTTTGRAIPVQPEPRPAPTATRKMELPSAL